MDRLKAISPVDGRYGERVTELIPYYSEFGLMRYRVLTEIEYFIALSHAGLEQFGGFPGGIDDSLRTVYTVSSQKKMLSRSSRRRRSPITMSRPLNTL